MKRWWQLRITDYLLTGLFGIGWVVFWGLAIHTEGSVGKFLVALSRSHLTMPLSN